MGLSALIAVGLPIGLFLGLRKRFALKFMPVLIGVAVFVVFALILEQVLHLIVLRPTLDGTIALRVDHPGLYALYGILAAGIFEETGRLVGFSLIKKQYQGVRTAISYGIGHGGIEAIILLGFTMLSNIAVSVMINAGMTTGLPDSVVAALTDTAPAMFAVGGIERIIAIALQISFSIIVWTAVVRPGHRWLFPVAIALHAIGDLPAVLSQIGLLSIPVTEALVAVAAIGCGWFAIHLARRALAEEKSLLDPAIASD